VTVDDDAERAFQAETLRDLAWKAWEAALDSLHIDAQRPPHPVFPSLALFEEWWSRIRARYSWVAWDQAEAVKELSPWPTKSSLTADEMKEIARLDAEIEHLESEIGLRICLREVTRTGRGYPPAVDD
jgi:hypothetical protein